MSQSPLLALPADWEPTRATLHAYAAAVGGIARAHAVPHPQWWHISLELRPTGLVTDPMPLPEGGTFWLRMDLNSHAVVAEVSDGRVRAVAMTEGLTGSEFGSRLIELVEGLGADGEYSTEKFAGDEPGRYDPEAAAGFWAALVNIEQNLALHRSQLEGSVGPLQVWPHGFDLAFEWFGTRMEPSEEEGGAAQSPAQLNLGFYPGGRAYFYSNPWPFDEKLANEPLPAPARWNVEGWQGSILYYDDLLATDNPEAVLAEYARTVFDLASPGLLA